MSPSRPAPVDRGHAHELIELGIEVFERETFLSAISLGAKVLTHLGHDPQHAQALARAFEDHDNKLLLESYAVRGDVDAYVGLVRKSMGLLNHAMAADEQTPVIHPEQKPDA